MTSFFITIIRKFSGFWKLLVSEWTGDGYWHCRRKKGKFMKRGNTELFEKMSIGKAVLYMAVPMIISQTITIIYNVADTFFVGQMNEPDQVAAITLALPLFYFLTALTNLFGVGGASRVSGFLGAGQRDKARKCAAFCIWSSCLAALIYGLAICLSRSALLPMIGADADTYQYTKDYVFWVITVGAVPTVFNPMIASLIRAEGYSRQAGFGVAFGGILNIILDPVFIFGLHLEIRGAAVATMLSAWAASAYFLLFLCHLKGNTSISLNPKYYTLEKEISLPTIVIGIPNFVISFMATLSNTVLNPLVAAYSNKALAGMGIAKKIDMLAFAIAQGMTQGTLPLISYNFSSGNRKRMMQIVRTAIVYGLVIACSGMILLLVSAAPLSNMFIADGETASYSRYFLRVIALTCPTTTMILMIITVFQAASRKVQPIIISMLRKGILDIPMMFALDSLFELSGIVWAIPLSDLSAFLVALCMFVPFMKRMKKQTA